MRRLFFRFYIGVLAVLFMAWYIHGYVLEKRAVADRVRVITNAHSGGARMVASELEGLSESERDNALNQIRERFKYPINIQKISELAVSAQQRILGGEDVICFPGNFGRDIVAARIACSDFVVSLGPFPEYGLRQIEDSIAGWGQLTAAKLRDPSTRFESLKKIQTRFEYPIEVLKESELPQETRGRFKPDRDSVFYFTGKDRCYAATHMADSDEVVRFGPFPSFEHIEQKAAATTLALVLLPAAIAIAFLLRPVSSQLRQVENAAMAIAAGQLNARVDERRIGSAQPLARAFNHMASRTEALVKTQRELLQAVSHELRTPLARIRFAIELIETAQGEEQLKQRLDSLDVAAGELDELVGELLRYVRLETTEHVQNKELISVNDVLEMLVPKYAALFPSIAFTTSFEYPKDEVLLCADRLGIQRVLGNLLSNAGKFARSKVHISVRTEAKNTILTVDDDGQGIPEADRERVFEPFVRLDNDLSQNECGVGLGLALVQRIVHQHDGHVKILTGPSGGCRIEVIWPTQS